MRAIFRGGRRHGGGGGADALLACPTPIAAAGHPWWCAASAAGACYSPQRHCSSSAGVPRGGPAAAAGAAGTTSRASSHPDSSYAQFQQQRQQFHQHSFYEKGTAPPRGESGGSASSASDSGRTTHEKDERVYGRGSATAQQRRQVRQHWEKSFFGRTHYEDGMHSRFAQALQAEEEAYRQGMESGKSHAELFPDWPEDAPAPRPAFMRLRPSLKLQYIVNRLSSGERRIRYAVDFGSMAMMAQLNLGELMVTEADELLRELGWMNEEVEARIDKMQQLANKIKYDYDLD